MISVIGLQNIPLIKKGDRVGRIIAETAGSQGIKLQTGDVVVVTQKVVSKAEGRTTILKSVKPSPFAMQIARETGRDPRHVEVILKESRRIIRMKNGHIITETGHGFVCANCGVDKSNVGQKDSVSLLPVDPDRSAFLIREEIRKVSRASVAVIVSDTFGRPWRMGHVNFAIGVAGMKPILDYRGRRDMFGHTLRVTMIAVADELASAAELVMKKSDRVPVAIIRGFRYPRGKGKARDLVRPLEQDLFR